MKLSGTITVAAPRDQVFEALRDARFFASCVDGVSDLEEIDERNYTAVLQTRVAYIKFRFDVEVQVTRMEAPGVIEAQVVGKPAGIVGRLTATALTELSERDGHTDIAYTIDSHLTGRLGSLGQPVLKSKAREMEREFTERLRAAFGEQTPEIGRKAG